MKSEPPKEANGDPGNRHQETGEAVSNKKDD